MTVEEGLVSFLKASISNLKLYPQIAPEGHTAPFCVYFRTTTGRWRHLQSNGSFAVSYQISIYHTTYAAMVTLRNTIREYLEPKVGTLATGSPYIMAIEIDNESDLYEADTKLHHGVLEFTLYHN